LDAFAFGVISQLIHGFFNLYEAILFQVVSVEQVWVDFVNENLVVEAWLLRLGLLNQICKFVACSVIFWRLCVDHVDESTTVLEVSLQILFH